MKKMKKLNLMEKSLASKDLKATNVWLAFKGMLMKSETRKKTKKRKKKKKKKKKKKTTTKCLTRGKTKQEDRNQAMSRRYVLFIKLIAFFQKQLMNL